MLSCVKSLEDCVGGGGGGGGNNGVNGGGNGGQTRNCKTPDDVTFEQCIKNKYC